MHLCVRRPLKSWQHASNFPTASDFLSMHLVKTTWRYTTTWGTWESVSKQNCKQSTVSGVTSFKNENWKRTTKRLRWATSLPALGTQQSTRSPPAHRSTGGPSWHDLTSNTTPSTNALHYCSHLYTLSADYQVGQDPMKCRIQCSTWLRIVSIVHPPSFKKKFFFGNNC